jgi:hypothetical protein
MAWDILWVARRAGGVTVEGVARVAGKVFDEELARVAGEGFDEELAREVGEGFERGVERGVEKSRPRRSAGRRNRNLVFVLYFVESPSIPRRPNNKLSLKRGYTDGDMYVLTNSVNSVLVIIGVGVPNELIASSNDSKFNRE